MKILLVEDDVIAARGIALMLRSANFVVEVCGRGDDALDQVRTYSYDLVILDLGLPDQGGTDVVRTMRSSRITTPILILSGNSQSEAKVKCLTLGADDYLIKPFDRQELIARCQAVIRRTKGFADETLRVGPVELKLGSREVLVGGTPVHLTGKEFSILELMMLRRNLVLTKEAFLNHLYGGMDEPEVKIIDVFICKLRKKLAASGGGSLIGTVWGRGYILRDEVERERVSVG